ncbi:MAG: radical SAM protein [Dehalococcoidia bacterium]|nr:radical SAM protein [Dehalococcoidia bacterium]
MSTLTSFDTRVREVRRRLAQEQGAVVKDWGGRVPVAVIYPNSYYIGMSNLGLQTIYGLLNADGRFVAERVFFEEPGARNVRVPLPPIGLESQRPLTDYAVLAFSISYEMDFANTVRTIKAAGIPLYACDRGDGDPLVIFGGACAITNPEPVAPFFDAIAIGEGETILPAMLDIIRDGVSGPRLDMLQALAKVPGVYVPVLHRDPERVARQYVLKMDDYATTTQVLTPETHLSNMYIMEVARGCGRGCRFCIAGYVFRPFRPRQLASLQVQAERGLHMTNSIGLLGAGVGDYVQLDELVQWLYRKGAQVSISSLRIDNLTDAILSGLDKGGVRNVTVAPEAGSERMRRFVNKALTEDQILSGVERVARFGIRQMKFYYMIGIPTEMDEDAQAIVDLTLKAKAVVERLKAPTRFVLDISPFVPKPGTAFQWLPMARPEVSMRRLELIARQLRPKGVEVKWDPPEESEIQTLLSRGGRELAPIIAAVPGNSTSQWRRTLREAQVDVDKYVYKPYALGGPLPWNVVDTGLDDRFFRLELRKSYEDRLSKGCPTDPVNAKPCHLCGVC